MKFSYPHVDCCCFLLFIHFLFLWGYFPPPIFKNQNTKSYHKNKNHTQIKKSKFKQTENNQLSGEIPTEFGSMIRVSEIELSKYYAEQSYSHRPKGEKKKPVCFRFFYVSKTIIFVLVSSSSFFSFFKYINPYTLLLL